MVAFANRGLQSLLHNGTHAINILGLANIRCGIIFHILNPATECGIGRQCTRTRVVQHCVIVATGHIHGFHINRRHRAVSLVKVHLQTLFICFRSSHDIHGEGCGGEGDGAVGGDHVGHKLQAVGALVVHAQLGAIHERGVGDGHLHGLSGIGLPLAMARIDRDVISGNSLFAGHGAALHGGGTHFGVAGHVAGHGKLHLLSICAQLFRGHHIGVAALRVNHVVESGCECEHKGTHKSQIRSPSQE